MPTDLPPDYKPQPAKPGEGKAPDLEPQPQGDDVKGQRPAEPRPDGAGLPGQPEGDVVNPAGVPSPAGTPTF